MIERIYSNNTGFTPPKKTASSPTTIKAAANPLESETDYARVFDSFSKKDGQLKRAIGMAINAYMVDGFIRNAVDRHAELFKDFELQGEPEVVRYVQKRLSVMSLRSGEHWKTTFSRYINEYFKHGNPFILKVRDSEQNLGSIPMFADRPFPISAMFVISPEKLEPVIKGQRFLGWSVQGREKEGLNITKGKPLTNTSKSLVIMNTDKDLPGVLYPGMDILHTAYKKPSDAHYGVGLTFAALEDVALLRNVEHTIAVMIKKNSMPILWHKITRPGYPGNIQSDINQAVRLHETMSPDGVIVTPSTHELKFLGSESLAMRNEGYLKYFAYRSFASMGVSPFLMGFEAASMGAVDAAMEILMQRIRFCQEELSRDIEMFLLNELLWEGGFDPFNNEKHVVKFVVKDIDEARRIKLQNHFSDLYNKNILTFEESRSNSGFFGEVSDEDLYLNRVTLPIEREKAKAKAEANPLSGSSTTKKPKLSKEFLAEISPLTETDLVDFVDLCFTKFGLDLTPYYLEMKNLLHDEIALVEYIFSKAQDQNGSTQQ